MKGIGRRGENPTEASESVKRKRTALQPSMLLREIRTLGESQKNSGSKKIGKRDGEVVLLR